MTPFNATDLRPELLVGLDRIGFTEMTPIQEQAIPPMLLGLDVIGQAQTGSGKTAAFGLAALNGLNGPAGAPRVAVLCPTRELAEQVATELRSLAQALPNTRITTLCGGRPLRGQRQALNGGVHVIVGTPGRIGKHLRDGTLQLDQLTVLILDEADRMLDMGFSEEVGFIVDQCPEQRQTLLFSATFPEAIDQLSAQVQTNPHRVAVQAHVHAEQLKQRVFRCDRGERKSIIANLLAHYAPAQTLIFCETRNDCKALAKHLDQLGADAIALHGGLEQRDRDDVMMRFGNGSASVLVATDVAARGIDIERLPCVIVSEVSPSPENHSHRVGRTGRAGQSGLALVIVCGAKESERFDTVQSHMGMKIAQEPNPPKVSDLSQLHAPNATLLLLAGRRDKLRKGDVMGALVKEGKVPPDAIGQIDLFEQVCAVAIERAFARQALNYANGARIKKKRIRARILGH